MVHLQICLEQTVFTNWVAVQNRRPEREATNTPMNTVKNKSFDSWAGRDSAYNNCFLGSSLVKALWESGKEKATVEKCGGDQRCKALHQAQTMQAATNSLTSLKILCH